MRVFLTGRTGFIGQPLTQALLQRGWEVTALVRTPDGTAARRIARMGATLLKGDITDRESMRAGMRGADMVVHNVAHVYVDDVAEGIALTAENGRVGEVYLLAGDTATLGEVFSLWNTTPGGLKMRLWFPTPLAAASVAPTEPVQRWLGLPAVLSAETVRASAINMHYSSDKAKREVGWNPRSYRETWLQTLATERELKHRRGRLAMRSRLKPLDSID